MSLLDVLKPKPEKKLIFTISMYTVPSEKNEGMLQSLWGIKFADENPTSMNKIIGYEVRHIAVKLHDEIITFTDSHSDEQIKDFMLLLMYQDYTLEEAFKKVEERTKNGEYKDIKA